MSSSIDHPEIAMAGRKFGKLQKQLTTIKTADPLALGKRKLHDSNLQEDSGMLDLSDEELAMEDLQKHCFIEELCICEINESSNVCVCVITTN
mgnify:CR=1 FL=1